MAIRINQFVTAGEVQNTSRNSVRGWIELGPNDGVRFELSGNLKGQFEGRHFRFRVNKSDDDELENENPADSVPGLAGHQIGVIGDVVFRQVKVLLVPIEEFYMRCKLDEPPPCATKDSLYLEWYSQDGRVVAELTDIEIEDLIDDPDACPLTAEPLPTGQTNDEGEETGIELSITRIEIDEQGEATIEEVDRGNRYDGNRDHQDCETSEFDELDRGEFERSETEQKEIEHDEFGLFDKNLDQQIQQSLAFGAGSGAGSSENETEDNDAPVVDVDKPTPLEPGQLRPWDEVIPGIDPETKAMYEQWDEIYSGENEEPVMGLFEKPFDLPAVETITTDDLAEPVLNMILSRLATFNVAIDLCEHLTPLTAYRLLVNKILPTAEVNPNLSATDIIEHYTTYDYCDQCMAEYDDGTL